MHVFLQPVAAGAGGQGKPGSDDGHATNGGFADVLESEAALEEPSGLDVALSDAKSAGIDLRVEVSEVPPSFDGLDVRGEAGDTASVQELQVLSAGEVPKLDESAQGDALAGVTVRLEAAGSSETVERAQEIGGEEKPVGRPKGFVTPVASEEPLPVPTESSGQNVSEVDDLPKVATSAREASHAASQDVDRDAFETRAIRLPESEQLVTKEPTLEGRPLRGSGEQPVYPSVPSQGPQDANKVSHVPGASPKENFGKPEALDVSSAQELRVEADRKLTAIVDARAEAPRVGPSDVKNSLAVTQSATSVPVEASQPQRRLEVTSDTSKHARRDARWHPSVSQPIEAAPAPTGVNATQPQATTLSLTAPGTGLSERSIFRDQMLDVQQASSAAPVELDDTLKSSPVERARPEPAAARSIVNQVIQSVTRISGEGSIEVRLQPEELGRVRLTLLPSEGGLTVQVSAERSETLDLLRRNADMLENDLKKQGFANMNFSFGSDMSDDAERFAEEESSQHWTPPVGENEPNAGVQIDIAVSPRLDGAGRLDIRV